MLPKIAILTDSASDISLELQKKYHLCILSLTIACDGKNYMERKDFTPQEYYNLLRESEQIPATSGVLPYLYTEAYAQFDKDGYDELIVVTLNARASGTNNAAHVGEEQFRQENPNSALKIHIIDSASYSMAYGYPVCQAAEMLENGAGSEEVISYLQEFFAKVEIAIAPYTLRYIQKSGRISAAAAFAGGILGLRPIITLINNESKVRNKVRGDRSVAPALCEYFSKNSQPGEPYLIGTTDMERGKALAGLCEKAVGYPPKDIFWLGCCVTTNTGPDADGIVYLGKKEV